TASSAAAANSQRPKPRPVNQAKTAPTTAPPAPTGEITFPIQLMKFIKAPSGWVACSPCTATFVAGAVPKFWAHRNCAASTMPSVAPASGFFHAGAIWSFVIDLPPLPLSLLLKTEMSGQKSDQRARKSRTELKSCQIGHTDWPRFGRGAGG